MKTEYPPASDATTKNSPRLGIVDASDVPPRVWKAVDYLVSQIKAYPAPGLVIEIDHPLAMHSVTKLAAMLGLISVAGSTDGRFYILQAASKSGACE